MPTSNYRRGQPSRGGNSSDAGKIVGSLVIAAVIGIAFFRGGGSRPSSRYSNSSSNLTWNDAPQQHSSPPAGYIVKGNISVTTGAKLYHVPGMRDYDRTVIDISRGEKWFRTEADAVANGWTRAVK